MMAPSVCMQGSFIMDSWQRRPERIVCLGDTVVVGTKSSALYVYDAASARLLRKFDVSPMARNLSE